MSTIETYLPRRRGWPVGRVIALAMGVAIILALVVGLTTNAWIALAVFIGVLGPFFLQGLRQIPASPPHKGVPTFLGERQRRTLAEGWHFFPIFPYLYGVVAVNVERKNLDFKPEDVRTPDTAELEVPISITYTPTPENLLAFLNSGGEEGVANILDDIAGEAIREWASATHRGPQTWREAYGAHAEALPIVINALVGRDVDSTLDLDELARMRAGNGTLENTALGITLNRVNITQIRVLGRLVEAAEKQAIEQAQRDGETIERDFLAESLGVLTKKGLTPEEARKAFQVERGKITETVQTRIFGVLPESLEAFGKAVRGEPKPRRGKGGKE